MTPKISQWIYSELLEISKGSWTYSFYLPLIFWFPPSDTSVSESNVTCIKLDLPPVVFTAGEVRIFIDARPEIIAVLCLVWWKVMFLSVTCSLLLVRTQWITVVKSGVTNLSITIHPSIAQHFGSFSPIRMELIVQKVSFNSQHR